MVDFTSTEDEVPMKWKHFAVFCVPVLLWAQGGSVGTVTGFVTDPSGAAIPAAVVTIRNVGTNSTREMKTGASGVFSVTSLPVGAYELKASAAGFQTTLVTDVSLSTLNGVIPSTLFGVFGCRGSKNAWHATPSSTRASDSFMSFGH